MSVLYTVAFTCICIYLHVYTLSSCNIYTVLQEEKWNFWRQLLSPLQSCICICYWIVSDLTFSKGHLHIIPKSNVFHNSSLTVPYSSGGDVKCWTIGDCIIHQDVILRWSRQVLQRAYTVIYVLAVVSLMLLLWVIFSVDASQKCPLNMFLLIFVFNF